MDWQPREFNERDIEYLSLLACWCLGEFNRNQAIKKDSEAYFANTQSEWKRSNTLMVPAEAKLNSAIPGSNAIRHRTSDIQASLVTATNPIKIKLLSQLTQELKTPLTSVIGMTSVLHREVYGPLTVKQREYLEIIHDSGQNLINLVDEIVSLGILNDQNS